jgi:hypothetical protein
MPWTDFVNDELRRTDIRTVALAKAILQRPKYGMIT